MWYFSSNYPIIVGRFGGGLHLTIKEKLKTLKANISGIELLVSSYGFNGIALHLRAIIYDVVFYIYKAFKTIVATH